jgi:membrane dipeptidase
LSGPEGSPGRIGRNATGEEQRMEERRDSLIANIHDDYSFELADMVENEKKDPREVFGMHYLTRIEKGGVRLQFYTVSGDAPHFAGGADTTTGTYRRFDIVHRAVEGTDVRILTTREDLEEVKSGRARGLVLTLEGAEPVCDVHDNDFYTLRNCYRLGLRAIGLFWFRANPIGDGSNERRNGGLTNYGRRFIEELNRLGIITDVSQGTRASVHDVIELAEVPLIASHSNAFGAHEHGRNLTDEELKGIAASGGMVGMNTYPAHLTKGAASIDDIVRHVDYVASVVGVDHVGMGLNVLPGSAERWYSFFDAANIEYTDLWLDGFEDLGGVPALLDRLNKAGYSDEDLAKFAGGNAARVVEKILD